MILLLSAGFVLNSQVTAPLPNPYSHSPTALRATPSATSDSHGMRHNRRSRGIGGGFADGFGGGIGFGGFINSVAYESAVVEAPLPAKEDKLKELIVSPTYQKDKITPKMIEIP